MLLIGIANHAHPDGQHSWPSVPTLAKYAHCDTRTVQRNLRALEDDGWIKQTGWKYVGGRADRAVKVWSITGRQNVIPPAHGVASAHARGDTAMPPEPSIEPSIETQTSSSSLSARDSNDIGWIFDQWIKATGRDPQRTKLTADRRRRIQAALKSHGLADCLQAVRNIGRDAWAGGDNDRGQPFNDVQHALGNAERIERWRDWTPPTARRNGADATSSGELITILNEKIGDRP